MTTEFLGNRDGNMKMNKSHSLTNSNYICNAHLKGSIKCLLTFNRNW